MNACDHTIQNMGVRNILCSFSPPKISMIKWDIKLLHQFNKQ